MAETEARAGGPLPREFQPGTCYMGRVPKGADLVPFLDEFLGAKRIRSGIVGAIGVVEKGRVGYFDAAAGRYVVTAIEGHREIASCAGNVSLRDGRPGAHLHIVLSDSHGETRGGHVMNGTPAHYVEFWVLDLGGQPFERGHDPETNVNGWVR